MMLLVDLKEYLKDKVVILGASTAGRVAWKEFRYAFDVVGFVDNDASKGESCFCGLFLAFPSPWLAKQEVSGELGWVIYDAAMKGTSKKYLWRLYALFSRLFWRFSSKRVRPLSKRD